MQSSCPSNSPEYVSRSWRSEAALQFIPINILYVHAKQSKENLEVRLSTISEPSLVGREVTGSSVIHKFPSHRNATLTSTQEWKTIDKDNPIEVWWHPNLEEWNILFWLNWVYLWENMHGIKKQTRQLTQLWLSYCRYHYWQTRTQSSPPGWNPGSTWPGGVSPALVLKVTGLLLTLLSSCE